MEIRKELITPEIAKKLLEKNDINRRFKMPVVFRYANDMTSGKWKDDTAELIKISKNNNLLDGQHRMKAVTIANIPVFFWVAYNLEESVFDVLDTGSSRSSADTFKVAGIKNDSGMSSIISSYNILKHTYNRDVQKHNKSTNSELLTQYNLNPDFWQFVFKMSSSWYEGFSKILPTSTIGAMFASFYHIHKEDAIDFMDQLCKGRDIKNPSIELLRKRLIQERLSNKKTTVSFRNALIIKVWNLYRKKEVVKVLKFDPEKEEFSKPI